MHTSSEVRIQLANTSLLSSANINPQTIDATAFSTFTLFTPSGRAAAMLSLGGLWLLVAGQVDNRVAAASTLAV